MFKNSIDQFEEHRKKEVNLGVGYPSILLHHTRKVQKCVICFHGYTVAPEQFLSLGEKLFNMGYNVYLPRLFLHGFPQKSKDTSSLTHLKLKEHLTKSIKLAEGLGDEISVVGLSLGGVLSAQAMNHFERVKRVVLISPAFGFKVGPKFLNVAVGGLLKWMPQKTIKWEKSESQVPVFRYDDYSTLALRGILELSAEVKKDFQVNNSKSSIFILLNDNDQAICNQTAIEYAQEMQKVGLKVEVLSIPKFYGLPHDFITPLKDGQDRQWLYNLIVSNL